MILTTKPHYELCLATTSGLALSARTEILHFPRCRLNPRFRSLWVRIILDFRTRLHIHQSRCMPYVQSLAKSDSFPSHFSVLILYVYCLLPMWIVTTVSRLHKWDNSLPTQCTTLHSALIIKSLWTVLSTATSAWTIFFFSTVYGPLQTVQLLWCSASHNWTIKPDQIAQAKFSPVHFRII